MVASGLFVTAMGIDYRRTSPYKMWQRIQVKLVTRFRETVDILPILTQIFFTEKNTFSASALWEIGLNKKKGEEIKLNFLNHHDDDVDDDGDNDICFAIRIRRYERASRSRPYIFNCVERKPNQMLNRCGGRLCNFQRSQMANSDFNWLLLVQMAINENHYHCTVTAWLHK